MTTVEDFVPKQTDGQHAADVHTFYGLDGSAPVVAPGYLPTRRAAKGASEFEKTMRLRLRSLSQGKYKAGPEEAQALQEARLPLKEREGGGWCIDGDAARKENDVVKDVVDQQRAADVRTFYGLDGSAPVVAPGYLPTRRAAKGASEFEKTTRSRLGKLTQDSHKAGPEEAQALQDAGLPLKAREGSGWCIDGDAALREKDVVKAVVDQERAADVRAFYGLDGKNAPVVARGHLPTRHAPAGASEFEKATRSRLAGLVTESYKAGPEEARALQEAGLPLKERGRGGQCIGKYAVRRESGLGGLQYPQNPVSSQSYQSLGSHPGQVSGSGAPAWSQGVSATAAMPVYSSGYGYADAGPSSAAGPSDTRWSPEPHAKKASKRGRG
ncbi:hypothetical protein [Streptomyces sp. NPDC050560]|uniref:hypothetical protein n=1 Tax=Streptomyces sp. NPDC050560 TaxID=3365630 RepID=UPI0037AE3736